MLTTLHVGRSLIVLKPRMEIGDRNMFSDVPRPGYELFRHLILFRFHIAVLSCSISLAVRISWISLLSLLPTSFCWNVLRSNCLLSALTGIAGVVTSYLLMLTGCPKCPVFCLSEGIRIYHLCRWGFQDFIICPGFTCMNWLPALGRCNNKKKWSDGYFTGHRACSNQMLLLKMAQGSAVRVSRFYHLSWFHLHELTPRLGALQQQKKRSDGHFTGHRPWLK